MPDLSAFAAALSSLNAAKDIAQAMITLRDGAAFQAKLIEFQSKIIDANNAAFAAQDERASLLEQIRDLKEEVAKLVAWETEKKRYELKAVSSGALAYVLKENAEPAEPRIGYVLSAIAAARRGSSRKQYTAWTARGNAPNVRKQ
jgi:hypothetical protein